MTTSALQTSLRAQKRSLRKTISAALGNIPITSIDAQSKAITDKICSLTIFKRAKAVSCYLSMPSGEVTTSSLSTSIITHSGKRLFVPKILNKDGIMDFFEIFNENDLATLPSGTWGIKEPDSQWEGKSRTTALSADSHILDLILLPGVAFDRSWSRLGHGKGYYDRFISTYTSSKGRPLLVGLALREQLLDAGSVPTGELDWKMDIIVTPDEILVNPSLEGAGAENPLTAQFSDSS
ncbi:5-formyltetrahydrofolate cyclo-ligase [Coprinopsis marcescibilis]|uniref:5-formyltetrahydrofolate cyclo-ligase n=1 Tax=Coprinopsis marcescibilis TaxID=230819 RepID=A0A5C3KP07_COPMA|nr:5-formyltetrahydrofolate cyclo-ligase [Coprinopsis marcescibilis]